MKHILSLLTLALFVCTMGLAQDKMEQKAVKSDVKVEKIHGYVVDAMCAKGMAGKETTMKKASGHTRACALEEECAKSGFGVFSEGKWYKFDATGDAKAKEMLEKTSTEKGIMIDVTGSMKDGQLVVASLTESKMGMMEKKMEAKPEEHKH